MIENRADGRIYLYPGEFAVSAEPCRITTILGSCVSVCLFDSRTEVGGMTHFILPFSAGNGVSSPRYGNVAVRLVVEALLDLGAERSDLRAKVFGGAAIRNAASGAALGLGARNVSAARQALQRSGIPVVAQDVGGSAGRKILFETAAGTVWVRTLGGASDARS